MHLDTTTLAGPQRSAARALALLAIVAFALALAPATYADERAKGPNGGQVRDAGKYHLELVVKENALTVYVTGAKDAKVSTKGASGSATVLTGKNTVSVKLEPAGENALAGSGKFESAPDMKIVMSLTLPGQNPTQARFTSLEKAKAGDGVAHHEEGAKVVPRRGALAEGEVRKVDKDAKKITIKHGPLPNLDMPAMTMVFQVKYPGMLDYLKAGDKVKFRAEKLGGVFTVTEIEASK